MSRRHATCADVASADLLIVNGGGLEGTLLTTLQNAGGGAKIVDASAGLRDALPPAGRAEPGRRPSRPSLLARSQRS